MTEKPEAYNTNDGKYGWDDVPLDPHYVYDQERMDKYLAERNAYIKQLRYELTKAKAYWWKYAYTNCDTYGFWTKGYRTKATKKDCMTYREQWLRIAEAYEARAAKILEGK